MAAKHYVSRAALKLASVSQVLELDFKEKTVLDVGSSTGGFTDFALQNGAKKVIAVDVGTNQLHSDLRNNPNIELHEKTDIRDFETQQTIDVVVIDTSFISLRLILPAVKRLVGPQTQVVAMIKPQFEAGRQDLNKGVVKNEHIRRDILKSFEQWVRAQADYLIKAKMDSQISGSKGNRERFYLLQSL